MTSDQRQHVSNGIWLCGTHAKMIDNDEKRYTVALLNEWKRVSEEAALLEIEEGKSARREVHPDVELINSYAQALDRAAFRDAFHQEGSLADFDQAIEDTILGINTGLFRTRKGENIKSTLGKMHLRNDKWRDQMTDIVHLLEGLRSRYAHGKKHGSIHVHVRSDGTESYVIQDWTLSTWMDTTRAEIMSTFASVALEAGVEAPAFHSKRPW